MPESAEEFYNLIMESEEKSEDIKRLYVDRKQKEELNKLKEQNNGK